MTDPTTSDQTRQPGSGQAIGDTATLTPTVLLPRALAGLPAGRWSMRADRCFVEFTLRRWQVPVVRGRLPAISGRLLVGDSLRMRIDVDGTRVHGAGPLGYWLFATSGPYGRIRFHADTLEDVDDRHVHLDGNVFVRDRTAPLALRTTVTLPADDAVLLHGTGTVPWGEICPAGSPRPRRGRVDIELAAEFRR